MKLIEVIDSATEKQFLNIPFYIYKKDKNWVSPLIKDIKKVFDDTKNAHFKNNGFAKRWVVKEGNIYIGRIAAFYHSLKGETHAGIGFFESINSQDCANLLFEAAELWLKNNNITHVQAPINFGARDSFWGLLVKGYEERPSYRENYNPQYYKHLFENFGFKKEFEQTTALIERSNFNYERFSRLSERVLKNPVYTFEYLNWNKLDKYVKDFETIYNKAWSTHQFFEPVKAADIKKDFKEMKPIAPSEYNIFVYADGKPVAFYLNLLDINQFFKTINGKLTFISKIKLLFYRSKINRIRGVIFGVIPAYQNKGLEVGMIMKTGESLDKYKKIEAIELAWVGDFNPKMLSMFKSMGAEDYKKHYTFSKNIFL